jgi:5-oxoprolinase (ATP-hydrolysing) subunit C
MDPVFEVLAPGLLTTVQDAGRNGFGDLGVPISGACDPWSLALANALLGNEPGAAALECTLLGPEMRALRNVVVAVSGADLRAEVRPSGRRIAPGSTASLRAGDVLALPALADTGARAYVAVPGGVDVPIVLGSRSTCLVAMFGGLDGRALRAGDVIGCVSMSAGAPNDGQHWPGEHTRTTGVVRILPGPDANPDLLARLTAQLWSVSPSSDRRGVRLVGSALPEPHAAGERLTTGVLPGTVQLPPDGQPIVLLADAQPTGGYPVIGVVVAADLPVVGQLVAAAEIQFDVVSVADARAANGAARAAFHLGRSEVSG